MNREERRRRAVELHEQGLSTQKVAAALGCTWDTARSDLLAAGFTFKRSTRAAAIEPRVCAREGCENVFTPKPAQLRKGYGKFCTRKCDHEAHRIYPQPEERVCARDGCEERFTPTGANVAMGWGKFHSKRCSALSTDAHRRKKGRDVECLNCGRTKWRYDSTIGAGFCSHECWGKYRWRNRSETISPDLKSLVRGSARQRWYGRWNGHKGAAAGIEAGRAKGGRRSSLTVEQKVTILELDRQAVSSRDIAERVLGDRRLFMRVQRFLRS